MAAIWQSHPAVVCGLWLLLAGNTLLPLAYGAHQVVRVLDYGSVFALSFWTAGLAWRRARREGPPAFGLLGLGAALGGLRYAPTLLPYPYAWFTGPALSILGLTTLGLGFLLWPQRVRMPRDRLRATLDGIALALSMFTVAYVAFGSMDWVGKLPRSIWLMYLLQMCVCLGLLALWLLQETRLGLPDQANTKRHVRSALIMLLCHSSLVALLRATGYYRYSYLGHLSEVLYQVANVFLALAALSPPSTCPGEPGQRGSTPMRALIPTLVSLAVLLLIAFEVFRPQAYTPKTLLGLGLGLMGILTLRHGLLILDLERLASGLESRVEERTRALEAHHQDAMHSLRLRMMAGLAAGLVHDLNNLLGIIRLRLALVRESCPAAQLEDLEVLQDASERAISMTRRILSSSQPQNLSPIPFCLTDWMKSQSGLLKASLLPGQSLVWSSPAGLEVLADPHALDQVLQNLVSNARDVLGPAGEVRILATTQDGLVRIEVQDDGPGIPAEHLANVFEPFFTTKPSGTGLGLATVRNLVLQNHGTIQAESRTGQGTTFIIELPSPS